MLYVTNASNKFSMHRTNYKEIQIFFNENEIIFLEAASILSKGEREKQRELTSERQKSFCVDTLLFLH